MLEKSPGVVPLRRTTRKLAFYPFPAADPGIALTLDLDDRGVSTAAAGFDAILRHGPIDLEIDFSEQNR